MNAEVLRHVARVYEGSDGDATLRLYAQLEALGSAGIIALNLFRAQKASERAKVYRGGVPGRGSYRRMAYDRKQWAMKNLAAALTAHGDPLGIRWGWAEDPAPPAYNHVLYVDLPTGQVSFHSATRGDGPEYSGEWDGVRDVSASRILLWATLLLSKVEVSA